MVGGNSSWRKTAHLLVRALGAVLVGTALGSAIGYLPILVVVNLFGYPIQNLPFGDFVWGTYLVLWTLIWIWSVFKVYQWLRPESPRESRT